MKVFQQFVSSTDAISTGMQSSVAFTFMFDLLGNLPDLLRTS